MYDEKKVEQEKKRRMEKYLFLMEIKDLIEDDFFENHWVDDVSDLLDDILPIVQNEDFIDNNDEIKVMETLAITYNWLCNDHTILTACQHSNLTVSTRTTLCCGF